MKRKYEVLESAEQRGVANLAKVMIHGRMRAQMSRNQIVFYLNGKKVQVSPELSLASTSDFLRSELGLCDTKVVCAEGDCGACTGLIYNPQTPELGFYSLNTCIVPVFSLDGCFVVTVQGIGTSRELAAVQKAMVENQGAQCGFCTPGFICAMSGLVEEAKSQGLTAITEKKARNHLTGNLCRCTGYEPILKSAQAIEINHIESLTEKYHLKNLQSELLTLARQVVHISSQTFEVFLPETLEEAAKYKFENPEARIVSGATDLGVLVNKGKFTYQKVLSLAKIPGLHEIKISQNRMSVGAKASLTQFEKAIAPLVPEFADLLKIFASPQIKNLGTLVGNVVNASPIGDSIPALMVLEARLQVVQWHQGQIVSRWVPMTELYVGYKQLSLQAHEIVTAIEFQIPDASWKVYLRKVSLRKDLDISAVTLAIMANLEKGKVAELRLAMGGVGPQVVRLKELEDLAKGQGAGATELQIWADRAAQELESLIRPLSDLRASKEYRMLVAQNLIRRFPQKLFQEVESL